MRAPDDVTTPEGYLASVPEDRREALKTLDVLIRRTLPDLEAAIVYGMIGYGEKTSGAGNDRPSDWAKVNLANQKRHISLYLCTPGPEGYLPELAKDRLGKVSVGKSCIRFTKLENLNLEVVEELLKKLGDR
ncbi:MAG: DUF1801 domain-containing protein [Haloferula sp.]